MSGNEYEFSSHLRRPSDKPSRNKDHNSAESTGDDEGSTIIEGKLSLLEQNHKKMLNQYQHTIKELLQTIQKQTAVKEQLSQELRVLGRESEEKKAVLEQLAKRVQEMGREGRAENHQETVASAYLIEQPFSSKSIRINKPNRPQLFTSQRIKPTLKACRSEPTIEDDYFPSHHRKTRQNQRLQ